MSLCTLPVPVLPTVCGISPTINVALVFTESHMILCRQSGQQVWSTRLPTPETKPVRLDWSPEGDAVAVIFENGSMFAYNVSNGRVISQLTVKSNVSSIAWSTKPTSSSLMLDSEPDLVSKLDAHSWKKNSDLRIAALGKRNGSLSIHVYGALKIDDLDISTSAIEYVLADEYAGEYAALSDGELSVVRTHIHASPNSAPLSASTSSPTIDACTSAEGVRLMEDLWESVGIVQEASQALNAANISFFVKMLDADEDLEVLTLNNENLEQITMEIATLALTGFKSAAVFEWIKHQHELGFIRWYKATTKAWDSLRGALATKIVPTIEQLILKFAELSLDYKELQDVLVFALEYLQVCEQSRPVFERVATFLEYIFTEEISRPITVTSLGKVDVYAVVLDVSGTSSPWLIDFKLASNLQDRVGRIRGILDTKVANIRKQVQSQLKVLASFKIDGHVTQILPVKHGYQLITDAQQRLEIDTLSRSIKLTQLVAASNVLVSAPTEPMIIGIDPTNRKLLINDSSFELDFVPKAVSARYDESPAIIAFVLSDDCQHYQFVEIPI